MEFSSLLVTFVALRNVGGGGGLESWLVAEEIPRKEGIQGPEALNAEEANSI